MIDAHTLATLLIGVCLGAGIAIAAGCFSSAGRFFGNADEVKRRIKAQAKELDRECNAGTEGKKKGSLHH